MNKSNILRFGILIVLIIWLIISYPTFSPIPETTSMISTSILNKLNIETINYGKYMVVDFNGINRIFELSAECSGIVLFSVFLFIIFLIPKLSLKSRLLSLFMIPIIFITNLIRILSSVIIANKFSINWSLIFHNTIGQVFIIISIALSYFMFLKLSGNMPLETKTLEDNKNE